MNDSNKLKLCYGLLVDEENTGNFEKFGRFCGGKMDQETYDETLKTFGPGTYTPKGLTTAIHDHLLIPGYLAPEIYAQLYYAITGVAEDASFKVVLEGAPSK